MTGRSGRNSHRIGTEPAEVAPHYGIGSGPVDSPIAKTLVLAERCADAENKRVKGPE